jgi:exodeoxyribonuclease-3
MRVVSLNVGNLSRTSRSRAFFSWAIEQDADVICIQSTVKTEEEFPAYADIPGYGRFPHHHPGGVRDRGVAIYARAGGKPVAYDPCEHAECLGRHLEVLLPNGITVASTYIISGAGSGQRSAWRRHLRCIADRMSQLAQVPAIICGDFNLAIQPEDLYIANAPSQYGYEIESRVLYQELLKTRHWVDAFRVAHPDSRRYSRWSSGAFPTNGWRIDYQFVSQPLSRAIKDAQICYPPTWDARFSDHAVTIADYSVSA